MQVLFWAIVTTVCTTSLIFSIKSITPWYEFIIGYEFEQPYSTPKDGCRRYPESNATINCETLYRMPFATDDGECRWIEPYMGSCSHAAFCKLFPKVSDVVCNSVFLQQTRVYIEVGLTRMSTRSNSEFMNPGSEHNTTDPNNWLFSKRRENTLYRVISSNDLCYGKSAKDTNDCINDFISQPQTLRTAYCWGFWCTTPDDGEVPWFGSIFIWSLLTILVIVSICILFVYIVRLYFLTMEKFCKPRNGLVEQEVYQPIVDPL